MKESVKIVRSLMWVLLLAGVAAGAGGCLISHSTTESTKGKAVPESTFAQIKEGETTIGWVQATLGEPTSKSTADDHIVYKYIYTERRDSDSAVFLIFGSSKTTETEHTAYIEFKGGMVIKKWRD